MRTVDCSASNQCGMEWNANNSLIPAGSFNQKMAKFVLLSLFHSKVGATIYIIPTLQLQQWCDTGIQFEQTTWKRNSLIEARNIFH